MPFHIRILVLQGTHGNRERPQCETRPNLTQLDAVVASTDVNMVPHFNAVVLIYECDDSVALVLPRCSIPRRKQVLEDLENSSTQGRCEILKDQVWVAFANGSLD